MAEKIIKGLALGGIFGILGYLLFKDVSTAFICGLIMFMSMFIKKKNQECDVEVGELIETPAFFIVDTCGSFPRGLAVLFITHCILHTHIVPRKNKLGKRRMQYERICD